MKIKRILLVSLIIGALLCGIIGYTPWGRRLGREALNQIFFHLNVRISQTDHPVTRDEALKHLRPEILPANAHDIQYYLMHMEVAPWFTVAIRFKAPIADCHALAQELLKETMLVPVSHPTRPHNDELPAWFDPQNILKGITAGKGYDGQPQIWIDDEHGVFYYYLTD